jgi:monoamine oxidase
MAKSKWTRREFLKASAWGTSALTLSSCSTLDRYFIGDLRNLNQEVVILGAGAAGLAAAFELKKRKIPFRIFEASSRVGGRVQSVHVGRQSEAVAELGAEFFDRSHEQIHRIARELKIPVEEFKTTEGLEPHLFYFNNRVLKTSELIYKLKTLNGPLDRLRTLFPSSSTNQNWNSSLAQNKNAKLYDSMTIKSLLNSWKSQVDPVILQLLELQSINRFGLDSSELSALNFIATLDDFGTSLLIGKSQFRIAGGATRLMQALVERVEGVIPGQIIKMNHALNELSEKKGVFELTFQTPGGRKTYTTSHVICSLPFTKLRAVKGLSDLQFSEDKKATIWGQTYGAHSKGFIVFSSPFWRQKQPGTIGNLGNFTGDFISQRLWDAGRGQETKAGIIAYQRGGKAGFEASSISFAEARDDLQIFYSGISNFDPEQSQMVNWAQRPWAQGSMAAFKAGEYIKYKATAEESAYSGRFLFAGEHTSLNFSGTLHGAFESGVKAASEVTI